MTESKIRVYRQQVSYRSINSRTLEITVKYYMHIQKSENTGLTQGLWIYPLNGYIANLIVKNSEGDNLPVLSYDEMNKIIQKQTTIELDIKDELVTEDKLESLLVKQAEIEKGKFPLSNLTNKNTHNHKHLVGIILPQKDDEYFEEITVQWVEQVDETKLKDFPNSIDQFTRTQHVVQATTINSTYVDISVNNEKYEIPEKPILIARDNTGKEIDEKESKQYIEEILCDKQHYVFRIKRRCPYSFTVKWKIAIPKVVRTWARIGAFISLGVLAFSVFSFFTNMTTLDFDSKFLAGSIALIIGLRVMLLHDSDLMMRWNKVYLILLIASITAIIVMAGLTPFLTPNIHPEIDLK